MVDNPEGLPRQPIIPARSLKSSIVGAFKYESQDLLFARDTNYYRRNVFDVDECIEIFGAS